MYLLSTIQCIIVKHLPWAKQCSGGTGDTAVNKMSQILNPHGASILVMERDKLYYAFKKCHKEKSKADKDEEKGSISDRVLRPEGDRWEMTVAWTG